MAFGNLEALVPLALNLPSCHNLLIMPLIHNSYLCIKGAMKAFVARGVTLGLATSVESHRVTNVNYARGTY
jgi:hypothetical protein